MDLCYTMLSNKATEGGESGRTHTELWPSSSQVTITHDESLFFPEMAKYLLGKGKQWINSLFCFACKNSFVLQCNSLYFNPWASPMFSWKWASGCVKLSSLQGLSHKMYLLSTPSSTAQISNRKVFIVLNSSLKTEDYQSSQLFYSS